MIYFILKSINFYIMDEKIRCIIYLIKDYENDVKFLRKLCNINREVRKMFLLDMIECKQRQFKRKLCLNVHFQKTSRIWTFNDFNGFSPVLELLEYNRNLESGISYTPIIRSVYYSITLSYLLAKNKIKKEKWFLINYTNQLTRSGLQKVNRVECI